MKTLLELYLRYFDFLYLDPNYHITDSTSSGNPTINASLTLTGPVISWDLTNDRGQALLSIAPTRLAKSPDNWFRVPLIRQYLDNYDETNAVSSEETIAWVRGNLGRLEDIFTDAKAERSCAELLDLAKALATKYYGPP
jgi:hypothetical protein